MKNVLVLGIGNRLMMDDGLGVRIVEILQNDSGISGIRYVLGETDIDYSLNEMEDADSLIIVDAVSTGMSAGVLSIFSLEKYNSLNLGISAHNLHLLHMIPHIYPDLHVNIIGIEVERIDFGLELSHVIHEKLPEITSKVRAVIIDILSKQHFHEK